VINQQIRPQPNRLRKNKLRPWFDRLSTNVTYIDAKTVRAEPVKALSQISTH